MFPRGPLMFRLCAGIAAVCVWVIGARIDASSPTVESVVPAIGQRGTTFTITLGGGRFKGPCDLLFQGPGLTCRKVEVLSENEARVELTAAPGCPLGAHPFRLRTSGGLSELRLVHVGRFPVVSESDLKGPRTGAMNTTIAGVLDSGEVDAFDVDLEKGARFSAEVEAIRLGGELTDTVLTVIGPDKRELARVDDTPITRQDPFVSFIAPAAGKYTIQVRESAYGGGPTATYALHLGDFPRPIAVFPAGAQAGKNATFQLIGTDDRATPFTTMVAEDAGPWWGTYWDERGRVAPTPTALRVRPYPGFDEGTAPRPWPVAFHGSIGRPDERDTWQVVAKRGDRLQVEVFAERVGSKLDSVLEVRDPEGRLVARNDDDESHDSRLVFTATRDAAYRLGLADKRREGGDGFHYRVEVEAPRPAVVLFFPTPARKSALNQVLAVPRGNRVMAYLGVRRDHCEGDVWVRIKGLPEGVRCDLADIPADTYLTPIMVEAAAETPLGATLLDLEAEITTKDGPVHGGFAQVVDLVPGPGESSYRTIRVDKLALVVTDEVPYRVTLDPPAAPLVRDGALNLTAHVERGSGYDEAVEVSFPYLPPGVEMEGPALVPAGESKAVLTLFCRPDADPVRWRLAAKARPAPPRRDRREMTMALQAQIGASGRRRGPLEGVVDVGSPFVTLQLAPAAFSGRFAATIAEQGKTANVTCELSADTKLTTTMTATLEGLPPRAEAATVEVTPGTRRIVFPVQVGPTTPLGEFDTLICRLECLVDGQTVVHRVGRTGLFKVAPPGGLVTDAQGKALSPLDALRRRQETNTPKSPNRP